MTLSQFLSTLSTANVQVKLIDFDTNKEILTFYADGYENLDDTLEGRPVKFWSIISTTSIKVILAPAVTETTPTTGDNTQQTTGDTTPTSGDANEGN